MDDLTSIQPINLTMTIDADERARRKAAVDYSRGSVRLEGFVLNSSVEDLNRRYIEGELTSAELTAAILDLDRA